MHKTTCWQKYFFASPIFTRCLKTIVIGSTYYGHPSKIFCSYMYITLKTKPAAKNAATGFKLRLCYSIIEPSVTVFVHFPLLLQGQQAPPLAFGVQPNSSEAHSEVVHEIVGMTYNVELSAVTIKEEL